MTLQEILALESIGQKIGQLKTGRMTPMPDMVTIGKEWDPKKHKIMDRTYRPDKQVVSDVPDGKGGFIEETRIELVARISAAFQKLIVKRATSFLFGNEVSLNCSEPDSDILVSVKKVLDSIKSKSLNKRAARTLFSTTEVAECWFTVKKDEAQDYGFNTFDKLRVSVFSPLKGDKLYPFFDQYGDMVAFSREYTAVEDSNNVSYFETWTDQVFYKYRQANNSWELAETAVLGIKKIPIVYAQQDEVEWYDVQEMIDRFEKLLSNFADTNDYHGSPKIVATNGEVKGFSRKGESGGILEIEGDQAELKYLAWEQAPESIKLEIENLFRLIFSLTQTPDISFEAVKGMGNAASGESMKMLFLDAHLKVMDKLEIFDDYLERRYNIIKSFLAVMNPKLVSEAKTVRITPHVIPYMIDDITGKLDNIATALSAGIISRETAISLNPLVDDPQKEIDQIKKEKEENASDPLLLDQQQNDPANQGQ